MLRIAVVEDESVFAAQMKEYLERYQRKGSERLSVTFFTDGAEIADRYDKSGGDAFDIIFMDIQMELLDGMTAAEVIRRHDPEVIIIFLTNMPQFAIRGYTVGAMDYVLKPISYFALSQRLDRAIARIHRRERHYVMVSAGNTVRKLDISRLRYVESHGHTLSFFTLDGSFDSSGTLQTLEKELSKSGSFYRCNKGCLVNLEHVDAIRDNCAIVGDTPLPISRGRKAGMMAALTDYVNGVMQ